jgi:hypothetical protein
MAVTRKAAAACMPESVASPVALVPLFRPTLALDGGLPIVGLMMSLITLANQTGAANGTMYSPSFCSAIFGMMDLLPDRPFRYESIHHLIHTTLAALKVDPVLFTTTVRMRLKLFAYRVLAEAFDELFEDNKTWLFDMQDLVNQAAQVLELETVPLTPRHKKLLRVGILFANPVEVETMLRDNVVFDFDEC